MKRSSIHVLMISKALVIGAYHKKLEEMCRLGIKLDVVIPDQWDGRKAEVTQSSNYNIHQLHAVFSGRNHFHYYSGLSALIEKLNPDIIHIDEESYSYVTYTAMRAARRQGIPAVFFNWQNIFKKYPWPFSAMERYAMKYAAAGIAGNFDAKDILLAKNCSIPLYVIPQFGVDAGIFSKQKQVKLRQEIIGKKNAFIVGFSGRFVGEKGISDLLKACSELPDKVHLVLIGSGPLRNVLVEQAAELKMKERFHIVDFVASTEMPKYLNILDCLVLPSLTRNNWKEQFGRVLIEAMACEVTVIGSNSGEIPNVIGKAGYIFRESNITELKNILKLLISDKSLRLKKGREGRKRVLEKFTQKKIAGDTLKVYRSIVKKI
ncbi:MAG: glycosyltransferase family 4 protein [Bacteroidetes bacterium]|nr:glycosyltransferase family 4 protein [Bacteroidota bacterium]